MGCRLKALDLCCVFGLGAFAFVSLACNKINSHISAKESGARALFLKHLSVLAIKSVNIALAEIKLLGNGRLALVEDEPEPACVKPSCHNSELFVFKGVCGLALAKIRRDLLRNSLWHISVFGYDYMAVDRSAELKSALGNFSVKNALVVNNIKGDVLFFKTDTCVFVAFCGKVAYILAGRIIACRVIKRRVALGIAESCKIGKPCKVIVDVSEIKEAGLFGSEIRSCCKSGKSRARERNMCVAYVVYSSYYMVVCNELEFIGSYAVTVYSHSLS